MISKWWKGGYEELGMMTSFWGKILKNVKMRRKGARLLWREHEDKCRKVGYEGSGRDEGWRVGRMSQINGRAKRLSRGERRWWLAG